MLCAEGYLGGVFGGGGPGGGRRGGRYRSVHQHRQLKIIRCHLFIIIIYYNDICPPHTASLFALRICMPLHHAHFRAACFVVCMTLLASLFLPSHLLLTCVSVSNIGHMASLAGQTHSMRESCQRDYHMACSHRWERGAAGTVQTLWLAGLVCGLLWLQ